MNLLSVDPWHDIVSSYSDVMSSKLSLIQTSSNFIFEIEKQYITERIDHHLLHINCLAGWETLCLSRQGLRVTGVDPSQSAIDLAREYMHKSGLPASFMCEKLENLPSFLYNSFDVVWLSVGSLPRIPDIDVLADQVFRCLEPGGQIFICDYSSECMDALPKIETDSFKIDEKIWQASLPRVELTKSVRDVLIKTGYAPSFHHKDNVLAALEKAGFIITDKADHYMSWFPIYDDMYKDDNECWKVSSYLHGVHCPPIYTIIAHKPQAG
jgi:SAM-dependent methyltransferase